jgi:hypothetical protein
MRRIDPSCSDFACYSPQMLPECLALLRSFSLLQLTRSYRNIDCSLFQGSYNQLHDNRRYPLFLLSGLVDPPHALKKPCRLQLRLKTPADTVLRQVTRMGSLSGATGPGFSSLVAMSRLGPKGPRDTSVESTMGAGGAGEPGFLKSESECVLDFRYCINTTGVSHPAGFQTTSRNGHRAGTAVLF